MADTIAKITPMLRQYFDTKAQYPDHLLLFRMGDFYEMFFEDAERASKILDIALTSRSHKNAEEKIPLCGIPHHALTPYLSKLIKAGVKVAICDQIEDPREAKGLVQRAVARRAHDPRDGLGELPARGAHTRVYVLPDGQLLADQVVCAQGHAAEHADGDRGRGLPLLVAYVAVHGRPPEQLRPPPKQAGWQIQALQKQAPSDAL